MKRKALALLLIFMGLGFLLPADILLADSKACSHEWTAWEVTREATIRKTGAKIRTCEVCGKEQKKELKVLTPYAKFKKKTYTLKVGGSIVMGKQVSYALGDRIQKWTSSRTAVATVSKKSRVTARKPGTARLTVYMKSGKKAVCTIKVSGTVKKKTTTQKTSSGGGTVYWTPGGGVYHRSRNCSTLKRSKTVYSGSISESGKSRACKVCG